MKLKNYPENWKLIAKGLKTRAGNKCQICGETHNPKTFHVLTVAHIIPILSLIDEWNLIVACQRCHIGIIEKISQKFKYLRGLAGIEEEESILRSMQAIALEIRKQLKVKPLPEQAN